MQLFLIAIKYYCVCKKKSSTFFEKRADFSALQTVDKALLLQGFAIVGAAFLI
jgi:hypothetical protein